MTARLYMERITCVGLRDDMGLPVSTSKFLVRGQLKRIYCSPRQNWKEDVVHDLESFRAESRKYEEKLVDQYGGRIKIEGVSKHGWWMSPASGTLKRVFVPLTAKVAKMGIVGSEFSGMRLGLAGGVWRPLPSGESLDYNVCYNVYPPAIWDFEGSDELKKMSTNNNNQKAEKTPEKEEVAKGVDETMGVISPSESNEIDSTETSNDLDGDTKVAAAATEPVHQGNTGESDTPSDSEKNAVRKKLIESIDRVLNQPDLTREHLGMFEEQTEMHLGHY